jgi:oxygen-independent coproporphyrinogen-3 oxidase
VSVEHIYLHLPFCASRCGYCAFVVEVGALGARDAYLEALLAELELERDRLGTLDTVYLGGGTPSLMRPRRIARLLEALGPWLGDAAEISIEANPETVDRRQLRELRAAGVNRLSLGVQSLRPHLLGALDRRASARQAWDAAGCARAAGFENLSVDLIFGVPGQTLADLEADLAGVLAIAPDHVSWYELEIKPGTALERMGAEPPDEDLATEMYRGIVAGLEAAGYRWYETANFARPGRECRHSLAYWGAADYLGLGVGAVSTLGDERRRNDPGLERYLARLRAGLPPARSVEALDPELRRRERWMLALRLDRPIDLGELGPPDRPEGLDRMRDLGLIGDDPLALTREGRFVQNAVLHELIEYA